MKKRWKLLLLALTLTFSMGTTAYADELSGADDWKVEFTADKEMVSNFATDAMNDTLDYLQPGDSATFKVELTNSYDSATDWYMTNKVIQSLEDASKTAGGGAYSYLLTYTDAAGTLTTIYDSDTIGGEDYLGEEGLHEATDALEDFFYLDTLEKGESGVVELRILLDGETQGNIYQDTLAQLQLNFAVELPTVTEDHQTVYDEKERVTNTYLQYTENGEYVGEYSKQYVKNEKGEYTIEYVTEYQTAIVNFVKTGDKTVLIPLLISAAVLGILLLVVAIYGLKLRGKMKKGAGMIAAVLLAGALALTIAPTTSEAAGYQYTVRVYAGAQGTFGTGASIVEMSVPAGKTVNLTEIQNMLQVSNTSKYYVKGIRESGKDNEELVNPLYTVNQDMDFVIAYGMKATDVTYTVQYLNADTGEELYPTQTFYGNAGDQPVVAYQYVENYVPQAYNLTKTLSEDSSENVFTFRYTYNPNGGYRYYETDGGIKYIDVDGQTIIEYIPGTYTSSTTDNGVTVLDGDSSMTGTEGDTTDNGGEVRVVTVITSTIEATVDDGANAGANAGADNADSTGETDGGNPLELINLDDEGNPLANGLGFADPTIAVENGAKILTLIMIIASAVIIAVFGGFLFLENRKKKQKAANQAQDNENA